MIQHWHIEIAVWFHGILKVKDASKFNGLFFGYLIQIFFYIQIQYKSM